MSYIKKLFTISVLVLAAQVHASSPLVEVSIDNEHIQTFRGKLGKWLTPDRNNLQSLAQYSGTSAADILAINDGKFSASSYMFIPYGEPLLKQLLQDGKGRRIQRIGQSRLLWPVETPIYTSRFGDRGGERHQGLDFGCPRNTVVVAADDGVVVRSGWYGGMGLAVAVQHPNGQLTWYAHNSAAMLKEGEQVKRGQILAYSGSTGRSTGPHVHFEVRFMEVALDPEDFLQFGIVRPDLVVREGPAAQTAEEVGLDSLVVTRQVRSFDAP